MTEYGFLQVLQALSYFKCVSGPTGFSGSTFRAFEGLFEEVAGCDDPEVKFKCQECGYKINYY